MKLKSFTLSYFESIIMAPSWQKYLSLTIISILVLYFPITYSYQQWYLLHDVYQQRVSLQHDLSQLQKHYQALKSTSHLKIARPSHTAITEYVLHQKIHIIQMQWEPEAPYLSMNITASYQNLMRFIQAIRHKFPLLHLAQLNIRKNLSENRGVLNMLAIKIVWRLEN